MLRKPTKGEFVEYVTGDGVRTVAIVRRVHNDGTCTVEARHTLTPEGKSEGCYLGYRFRLLLGCLIEATQRC